MNARETVYLTPEGKEQLRRELDELVNVKRPALADRLRKAIQQGDLWENANYQTAKEEQAFLEGRIQKLEAILRDAKIIQENGPTDAVGIGSRVTVVEQGTEETQTYHIVGSAEADPGRGKVSHESPIGRALLGHQAGELVTVEAPAGGISLRITTIQ